MAMTGLLLLTWRERRRDTRNSASIPLITAFIYAHAPRALEMRCMHWFYGCCLSQPGFCITRQNHAPARAAMPLAFCLVQMADFESAAIALNVSLYLARITGMTDT